MKIKVAYFERFAIEMPEPAVNDCYHQGPCDDDVEYWQGKIDLSDIDDQSLAAELKGYGAWSQEELCDREANERRILWLAAGMIQDEENEQQNERNIR